MSRRWLGPREKTSKLLHLLALHRIIVNLARFSPLYPLRGFDIQAEFCSRPALVPIDRQQTSNTTGYFTGRSQRLGNRGFFLATFRSRFIIKVPRWEHGRDAARCDDLRIWNMTVRVYPPHAALPLHNAFLEHLLSWPSHGPNSLVCSFSYRAFQTASSGFLSAHSRSGMLCSE